MEYLRPLDEFREVMNGAVEAAGGSGTDSLDFFVAVLGVPQAALVISGLGADPIELQSAARLLGAEPVPGPGMTDDAKAVIEPAMDRAMAAGRAPGVLDILFGLVRADCRARLTLNARGIDEGRLVDRL